MARDHAPVRDRLVHRPRVRAAARVLREVGSGDPVAGRRGGRAGRRRTRLLRIRHETRPLDLGAHAVLAADRADRVRDRADLREHPGRADDLRGIGPRDLRRLHDLRLQPAAPGEHGHDGADRGRDLPRRREHLPVLPADLRGRQALSSARAWGLALMTACALAQAAPARARPSPVSGTHFFDTGFEPSISGDGRFIAYAGGPSNVFQNGAQVYLNDRRRRRTELVSRSVTGGQPDAQSLNPSISSNGRYVAFQSDAATLVTGDNNDVSDVFVRDRTAGTTTRVSVGPGGAEADGPSVLPSISANGRVVAFVSRARNLGGPDTGDTRDVFVRDLDAGTTTRVSIGLGGAEPNGESYTAAISGDGRSVVFGSAAWNLVSDDTNGFVDVFAFDRASGSIRRVNLTAAGDQATGDTLFGQGGPVTDASGDVFAFGTFASNLLGGPSEADVVARDSSAVQRLSTGAMLDN